MIRNQFTRELIDSVTVRFLSTDSIEQEVFISSNSYDIWNFNHSIKAPGKYILHFSKEGYEDTYKNVHFRYRKYRITSGSFGEVLMKKKSTFHERILKEATVSATRIKMVRKGDTIVYNADAFQLQEGSMLDQLVRMLPGVELKRGGEIFVNGKKVSSLLVNGDDFFRGDARVALENLPAYMVDKVKVYEQGPDADELKYMRPEEYRHGERPLVMDVGLKKKYSIGWIANGGVGAGTADHYSLKAFALRFTPQSRLAFMGYSNNVYANSYYDADGNWQSPGGGDDVTTHELTSDLLVKDKRKRYKVNNTLTFKWTELKEDTYQSTTSYFGEGNVYGANRSKAENRTWYLRNQSDISLQIDPRNPTDNLSVTPDVSYTNYRNSNLLHRADFDRRLSERYMGEALDSLFFNGGSDLYRTNLISSLAQDERGKGDRLNAKIKAGTQKRIGECDILYYNGSASYRRATNRNLFESYACDRQDLQDRFSDNPQHSYAFSNALFYRYFMSISKTILSITPGYAFSQDYRSADRSYYRLEDTEFASYDIDRLASTKDLFSQYLDLTNSAYSDELTRTHDLSAAISLYKWDDKTRASKTLNISLPVRSEEKKFDYRRGAIDTLMRNRYTFFEPSLSYAFDQNKDGRERHLRMGYSLKATSPESEYLTGYRDDATPLTVRTGNPRLQSTRQHEASASYRESHFKDKYSMLSLQTTYTLWTRQVCQAVTYDAATGTRTYRPENIDGNWGVNTQLQWQSDIDKKQRMKYILRTDFSYRHNVDYAMLENALSSCRSSVDRYVTRQNAELHYGYKQHYYTAAVNAEWTHASSQRFSNLDAFNINYRLSGSMPLPGKFTFSTNLTLYTRYGYSDNAFNTRQWIWNARLSRPFWNGRLKAEIEAFDLLDEMSSYSYAVNAQMQTETYRNILRRYVMMHLTFRLNREPKK